MGGEIGRDGRHLICLPIILLAAAALNCAASAVRIIWSGFDVAYVSPHLLGSALVIYTIARLAEARVHGRPEPDGCSDSLVTGFASLSVLFSIVASCVLLSRVPWTWMQFTMGALTSLFGAALFVFPISASQSYSRMEFRRALAFPCVFGLALMIGGEAMIIYAHV